MFACPPSHLFRVQLADIIYIIDKRLNDHGKYWRHVYKTLLVLEYCVVMGAEDVVAFGRERLHEIRTLREFIYVDDHGNDHGISGTLFRVPSHSSGVCPCD